MNNWKTEDYAVDDCAQEPQWLDSAAANNPICNVCLAPQKYVANPSEENKMKFFSDLHFFLKCKYVIKLVPDSLQNSARLIWIVLMNPKGELCVYV